MSVSCVNNQLTTWSNQRSVYSLKYMNIHSHFVSQEACTIPRRGPHKDGPPTTSAMSSKTIHSFPHKVTRNVSKWNWFCDDSNHTNITCNLVIWWNPDTRRCTSLRWRLFPELRPVKLKYFIRWMVGQGQSHLVLDVSKPKGLLGLLLLLRRNY